ncbi:hypothetical protein [Mycolicibacterium phlei]
MRRLPRPVQLLTWKAVLVVVLAMIVGGGWLFAANVRYAWPNHVMRFTYGDRTMLTPVDRMLQQPVEAAGVARIRSALDHDQKVIIGYVLLLLACAAVFGVLAISRAGVQFSGVLLVALGIAATTDQAENALFAQELNRMMTAPGELAGSFWQHSLAAVATLKWCALAVAVLSIPVFVFAVGRVGVSHLRRVRYRTNRGDWWEDSVVDDDSPLAESPQTAWARNYHVPGADAAFPKNPGDRRPTALCLSGGGIRSACVAMGAMQALAGPRDDDNPSAPPRLDDFDYIISVSGGGYSAGARLMAVQPALDDNGRRVGDVKDPLASRFTLGSPEFEHIRKRSSYIADSPLALVRALAEVLKNLVASLLVVFSTAILLGAVLGWFVAVIPLSAVAPVPLSGSGPAGLPSLQARPEAALMAVAIPLAVALACTMLRLSLEYWSDAQWSARIQQFCRQIGRGAVLFSGLVLAFTVALPLLMRLSAPLGSAGGGGLPTTGVIGGVATVAVVQYATTLFSMLRRGNGALHPSWWRRMLPAGLLRIAPVVITLGVFFVVWALVLGIAASRAFTYITADPGPDRLLNYFMVLAAIAAGTWLISSFDVTSLSLHPFYRERLARTFAVRRIGSEAVAYPPCEPTTLDIYGRTKPGGPKFVFAAAAAISDDRVRPAPGLNAVSYVMTADHIGGPALGWLKTSQIVAAAPVRIKRDLTVQAAVAVSGAAFSSAMGRQAKGFQALLALSGARLGTWLPNPRYVRKVREWGDDLSYPKSLPTVRGAGYLYRELFGVNKSESRLVQVTDGGHYENLGLVEALRRRCRLIYCIDGGGDAPPLLSGLTDAIRLAKFELGVEITLEDDDGPFGVDDVAPGSGVPFPEGHPFHCLNERITRGVIVRGRITYPAAAGLGADPAACTGWLIVGKAVLWRELPEWVLTHAANTPAFPHDKTSDQWFDEPQFSSYVELGRRIGARLLEVPADGRIPAKKPQRMRVHSNGHRAHIPRRQVVVPEP